MPLQSCRHDLSRRDEEDGEEEEDEDDDCKGTLKVCWLVSVDHGRDAACDDVVGRVGPGPPLTDWRTKDVGELMKLPQELTHVRYGQKIE
jgi:hypothetical protein